MDTFVLYTQGLHVNDRWMVSPYEYKQPSIFPLKPSLTESRMLSEALQDYLHVPMPLPT